MKEGSLQFAKHLNERGLEYEELCAGYLKAKGYAVQFDRDHDVWDADLQIEPNIRIEVKGSRLHKLSHGKQGYGFLLHKANRSKRIEEPVIALVCMDDVHGIHYFFFVPTAILAERNYIEFRNPIPHQAAKGLTEFYAATEVLDALGATKVSH